MRIVDADRLKKSFEANTPIAFQDCVPGIQSIIDLEPTVEAIPVWFIKGCQSDHLIFITELINAWEERKEE